MDELAIKTENLKKRYYLGSIGTSTVRSAIKNRFSRKKYQPASADGSDKTYDSGGRMSFYALDGIDLEIKKGEAVGIIGGNGAGKSTLLKLITRITAPTEGDIWINGRVSSMLEVGTGFHGELTGRENIYMNGAILGMTKKEVDSKLEDIIEFSECRDFIDTPVKRYSSGMYVKLAFSVAAHLDSEILLMDEVLAVGDVHFQKKCLTKMKNSVSSDDKTVLYVSHNMETVRSLCTRCVVLQKGKIIFDGDVSQGIEIYADTHRLEIASGCIDNRPETRGTDDARHGTKIRMNEILFKNKDILIFSNEENAEIKIKLESMTNIEELQLGMFVFGTDDIRIGFQHVKLPDVSGGTKAEVDVKTSFRNLPGGIYKMQLQLYIQNSHGEWEETLDVTDRFCFKVEQTSVEIKWRYDWFGRVNLAGLDFAGMEQQ